MPAAGDDRAEYCLRVWAAWMRAHSNNLGYPDHSAGIASGGINCWDDFADSIDHETAIAADASVDSLHAMHKDAIHHAYLGSKLSLSTSIEDILEAAIEAFTVEMRRRWM